MRPLLILLVLTGFSAFADANPELDKANRFLFDQKYPDAAKALDAATKVTGNSREVVLRIYELQGIVCGQLGQTTKAREAFQSMLSLDPRRELNGHYNQKVLNVFAAAKEWAEANSPLEFKSAKAAVDAKGKVMQLAAKMKSDAMRLVRKVRFHLRPDDSKWSEQDSELQGAYAAANTEAAGVEWWAELLGDNDRVLMLVGSEADPVREGKARDKGPLPTPAIADAPKKTDEKVTETKPVAPSPAPEEKKPELREEVRGEVAPSSGPLRPVGYVLMGAGVVSLGVGAIFGVMSLGARGKVTGATPDPNGLITSLSQKDAFALDKQATSQALIANVLFVTGGALAVTGGIFWFVGGSSSSSSSESASLTVAPTLGGVVIAGGF